VPEAGINKPNEPATEALKRRRGLPLWLWMLVLTVAIVATLIVVGRNSFAA
jgi:hypothetical protein